MSIKNIILDRDGVINLDSDNFIKSTDEFIFIDNSINALKKLADKNLKVFITTNQSGIARKLFDLNTLIEIHQKLLTHLDSKTQKNITAILYCPHGPDDNCLCRKPLPGMINKIKTLYDLDLQATATVGDSMRDLEAGIAAGCKYNFLVKTGKGLGFYNKNLNMFNNTNSFDNLNTCVDYILQNHL